MPCIVLDLFIFYLFFLKMLLRNGHCCDSDLAGEKNSGTERLSDGSVTTQTELAASCPDFESDSGVFCMTEMGTVAVW